MIDVLSTKYSTEKQLFFTELQELLLFQHWSKQLLEDTSTKCGFDKHYHYVLFPDGVKEVVDFCEQLQDQVMLQRLRNIPTPLKVREKISTALIMRIKSTAKLVHIRNATYFALPQNLTFATKFAWNSCDAIWYYAGDKATDFNYYSKRILLVSIYLSSILFYIADESEDTRETDDFIQTALGEIIKLGQLKQLCQLPKLSNIPVLRLFV